MEREMVAKRNAQQGGDAGRDRRLPILPGPLAIQVGIWISYIRGGFWGAWAGGWAFILPNFVIVATLVRSTSISVAAVGHGSSTV